MMSIVDVTGWDGFDGICTTRVALSSIFTWDTLGWLPYAGSTRVSGVSGSGVLPDEEDLGLEGSRSGQAAWVAG